MHRCDFCTGCDCTDRGSKAHRRDLTVYDVEVAGCVSVGSICVHAKKQEAYKGPLPYAIVKEDDAAWGFAPAPGPGSATPAGPSCSSNNDEQCVAASCSLGASL